MARPLPTSWTLIRGAASGDPSDRELFARLYRPVIAVYLAARWQKPIDHPDVQDGVQEVFIQCLRSGGALEKVESTRSEKFRAFLYGVTRHVAATIDRKERRHAGAPQDPRSLDEIAHRDASLSHVFDRAWAAMIAREARLLMASRLESKERAHRAHILELRYMEDLPAREVAVRLGLPVEDVYRELRRAKVDFRVALRDVLRQRHPTCSGTELERRCQELARLL